MQRLGRLERLEEPQRLSIHRRGFRQLNLFVDVLGTRRQGNPNRHGLGELARAHRVDQRGAQLGGKRHERDAELERNECRGVHGIRRLEREQSGQWLAVHRRALSQRHLPSHLHRRRRQCDAIGNGFRQGVRADGHAECRSERHQERRQRDTELVGEQCDFVCRLRKLVWKQGT